MRFLLRGQWGYHSLLSIARGCCRCARRRSAPTSRRRMSASSLRSNREDGIIVIASDCSAALMVYLLVQGCVHSTFPVFHLRHQAFLFLDGDILLELRRRHAPCLPQSWMSSSTGSHDWWLVRADILDAGKVAVRII